MNLSDIINILAVIVGCIGIYFTIISIRSKKVITVSYKSKEYASKEFDGEFIFDYSNNDGNYRIGNKEYCFDTKWSKASDTSIHAYKDNTNIDSIAIMKNVEDIRKIDKIEGDFSSRVRTPKIGEIIIWKNVNGKYAATKILEIKDDTRGDEKDELHCQFVIFH